CLKKVRCQLATRPGPGVGTAPRAERGLRAFLRNAPGNNLRGDVTMEEGNHPNLFPSPSKWGESSKRCARQAFARVARRIGSQDWQALFGRVRCRVIWCMAKRGVSGEVLALIARGNDRP